MEPHQLRAAYWVPNPAGLRRLGLPVEISRLGNLVIAKLGRAEGFGPAEEEACLSLLNSLRDQIAVPA
jgi:hypothetical protein